MLKRKTTILTLILLSLCAVAFSQDVVNQRQIATRYHQKFENRKTSSGERFSHKKYTAAHKNIKLGTLLFVADTVTKKWVIVKVNDRCPRRNIVDLAGIAADRIGLTKRKGVTRVLITTLPDDAEPFWSNQDNISSDLNDSILLLVKLGIELPKTRTDSETNIAKAQTHKTTRTAEKKPEQIAFKSSKLYIFNIENTDRAEDILKEMNPNIANNAKIINDTDTIRIEIQMTEGVDNFETHFKAKYPQYTVTTEYNCKE